MKKLLYLTVLLFLTGCNKPTYPDKNIIESIKARVAEEYEINDINVERVNNTLWVHVPVEKLVDDKFELAKEALEKVGNVSLVCSRVLFSSDAEIEFIALIAYDSRGIELKMFRNTEDVKKVQAWYIAYSDFYNRMDINLGFNPVKLGENVAESTYSDMSSGKKSEEIEKYFLSDFDKEIDLPAKIGKIREISSLRLDQNKALIHMETSSPDSKLLFLIDVEFFDVLKQLLILYLSKEEELLGESEENEKLKLPVISGYWNLNKEDWPDDYLKHRNVSQWKDIVYTKEINFKQFIADQIERRITRKFEEKWEMKFVELEVTFLRDEILVARQVKELKKPEYEVDTDYEIKLSVAGTIKSYKLNDVESLVLGDPGWEERETFNVSDILELKQKKWKKLVKEKGTSIADVLLGFFVPGYGNAQEAKDDQEE